MGFQLFVAIRFIGDAYCLINTLQLYAVAHARCYNILEWRSLKTADIGKCGQNTKQNKQCW